MDNTLRKHVSEMKQIAELLMPNTFPVVDYEEEQEVMVLKQRAITIDGYEVLVALSRADYNKYHVATFQISSMSSPFLPFNLVCNLARLFLGPKHLSYIEFLQEGRKMYCWTLRTSPEGSFLPPGKETEVNVYEGFEYNILNTSVDDVL